MVEKTHKFVNPGARIASSQLTNVPVVAWDDLARCSKQDREILLAGKQVNDPDSEEDEMDNGGNARAKEDHGSDLVADDTPKKRKRIRRQSSSPPDGVIAYYRPTPPSLVAELNHMFGASKFISGTPELGSSLIATLLSGTSCMALCKNAKHKELLDKNVQESVATLVVKGNSVWTNSTLKEQWAELNDTTSDEDDDDEPPAKKLKPTKDK